MTLQETISIWKDDKETHRLINERFTDCVNADPELKAYRDWIEQNIFGFGERSFLWMWKLLVDEMPIDWRFLEIGVFRGQILALVKYLSIRSGRFSCGATGITPLDSTGGHWESNYEEDIKLLHNRYNLTQPKIIKGISTEEEVIKEAGKNIWDIVYIDGGHSYEVAKSDILNYSGMVKVGGYLVIDDCANKYNLPEGYFRGIDTVSKAVDELLPNEHFKELFSVVHNRVFQRIG